MKKLLFVVSLTLGSVQANSDDDELFSRLIDLNQTQNSNEQLAQQCKSRLDLYDTASYVCAYRYLNDAEFVSFLLQADEQDEYRNFWKVELNISFGPMAPVFGEIEGARELTYKMIDRVFEMAFNGNSNACSVVEGLVNHSDGYFSEGLAFRLYEIYTDPGPVDECIQRFDADIQEYIRLISE
ncbi:hypothetical protein [Saccharospirillum mangrovi]|uniref:hypothetical protein n=1 Tax=Saccharospirillum mangrovi TaxID=2161747 RepID=UPI000D3B41FC|nr:hypothetical protein [Saccharospirillum mangrovi]